MSVEISELPQEDRHWVRERLGDAFGSPRVVSCGVLYQADELPGLVARFEGQIAGFLTFDIRQDAMEVVALVPSVKGAGIAEALLDAAADRAQKLGCRRLWLVTTNDNTPAQRFYEQWGLKCVEVRKGAIEAARTIKPEIPRHGVGGVPIEDEWIYECRWDSLNVETGTTGAVDDVASS